jgi:hypothetical protein
LTPTLLKDISFLHSSSLAAVRRAGAHRLSPLR